MFLWKRCDTCQYTHLSYPTESARNCSLCGSELLRGTNASYFPQRVRSPSRARYSIGSSQHATGNEAGYSRYLWSPSNWNFIDHSGSPASRDTNESVYHTLQSYSTAGTESLSLEDNEFEWTRSTRVSSPSSPQQDTRPVSPTSIAASLFVDGLMGSLTLDDQDNARLFTDPSSSCSSGGYSDGYNVEDHEADEANGYEEHGVECNEDEDEDSEEDKNDEGDEDEQYSRIPEYWDVETSSYILEGKKRPKVFEGEQCRHQNCGQKHPTRMHDLMWLFQEVWTPKHSQGVASNFFCAICTARRGPNEHSHTTIDHDRGEWKDHPEVDFGSYLESRPYAHFANPWYQFQTAKRPFPLYYYDPDTFDVPEDYPVISGTGINSGLWYGTPSSVESLYKSLIRVIGSREYSHAY